MWKTNDKSYGVGQTYQGLKSLFKIFHSKRAVWVGEGRVGVIGSLVIQVQLGLCCGGIYSFADLQKGQSACIYRFHNCAVSLQNQRRDRYCTGAYA